MPALHSCSAKPLFESRGQCSFDTGSDGALHLQAAAILGVALKDVIHSISYLAQTSRDFEIDRLTYKILHMALYNAQKVWGPHRWPTDFN